LRYFSSKHIESLLRKYHLDDIHYDSTGNLTLFTVEEETTFKGVNNYMRENKGKICAQRVTK